MSSISGISSSSNLYTPNVRKTTSSSTENPFENSLESLVSDGTITQEQEDAIAEALKPPTDKFAAPPAPPEEEENPLKDLLESLTSNGTITQEQEDAIAEILRPFNITAATDSYLELQDSMQNAMNGSEFSMDV